MTYLMIGTNKDICVQYTEKEAEGIAIILEALQ